MGDCCSCLGEPYPEASGGGFAPFLGLPQDTPSLWYDADFEGNCLSGSNIVKVQARYGTQPALDTYTAGGFPGTTPVVFGSKHAFPADSFFRSPDPKSPVFGAYSDPLNVASIQHSHVIAGRMPPSNAVFHASGYMAPMSWYYAEFYPLMLRRVSATDWRLLFFSGSIYEAPDNFFPYAGLPFVYAVRQKENASFQYLEAGANIWERELTSYGGTIGSCQNIALGCPLGYPERVWKGQLACYGAMTASLWTNNDIRNVVKAVRGYYGV